MTTNDLIPANPSALTLLAEAEFSSAWGMQINTDMPGVALSVLDNSLASYAMTLSTGVLKSLTLDSLSGAAAVGSLNLASNTHAFTLGSGMYELYGDVGLALPNVTSLSFSGAPYFSSLTMTALGATTLDLSLCTSLQTLSLAGVGLVSVTINPESLTSVDLSGNALSTTCVNQILDYLANDAANSDGTLNLSGGSSSAPTPASIGGYPTLSLSFEGSINNSQWFSLLVPDTNEQYVFWINIDGGGANPGAATSGGYSLSSNFINLSSSDDFNTQLGQILTEVNSTTGGYWTFVLSDSGINGTYASEVAIDPPDGNGFANGGMSSSFSDGSIFAQNANVTTLQGRGWSVFPN